MSTSNTIADIENYSTKPTLINENKIKLFMKDLIKAVGSTTQTVDTKQIDRAVSILRQKYKVMPSKSQMRYVYEQFYDTIPINHNLGRYMIKKAVRSRSGVLVSTIVLKPDVFSCPKKCAYCPTETDLSGKPTQPKSYLSSEPAMLRALQYNFDVRGQLWDRIRSYIKTGNILESDPDASYKFEIIISGGTWESYPYEYRKKVMNELYWGANTYNADREMMTIEEEIKINETSRYRIIGLTIETRPDFITRNSIKDYRRWGVTRVQIGVQHYNDDILDGIKRECHTKDTIRAIRILKQVGLKVVCHLMPDLPGSNPELDKWMFDQAINNPDLQFDDVKVYPTAVCQSSDPNLIVKSDIADWYRDGTYVPYAEKNLRDLIDVLKYYKTNIQPWVRIQRLVRDIPKQSIEVGYEGCSNLRQVIQDEMKREGIKCKCIRCMEIGDEDELMDSSRLVVRPYIASQGQEYHITVESNEKPKVFSRDWFSYVWFLFTYYLMMGLFGIKTYWKGNIRTYNGLVGFCRLRLDSNPGGGFINELEGCALIREVHVYGHSLGVGSNGMSSQHKGFGQLLVRTAEEIAVQNGYSKIAVIAGVGTRQYYHNKCGYNLEGTYMIKNLEQNKKSYVKLKNNIRQFWLMLIVAMISIFLYLF